MSADVLIERGELVRLLAAWSSTIASIENRAAAVLAEIDARACAEDVTAGEVLGDLDRRAGALAGLARGRYERAVLAAVVAPWTPHPWRAPSRPEPLTPERTSR